MRDVGAGAGAGACAAGSSVKPGKLSDFHSSLGELAPLVAALAACDELS